MFGGEFLFIAGPHTLENLVTHRSEKIWLSRHCPYVRPSVRPYVNTLKTKGAFHSTKNSGVNFRKFPWVNGTDVCSVENDKPHSVVRLEFFNDFEV